MDLPAVMLVTPNEIDARLGVEFLQDAGIAARACGSLAALSEIPVENIGCAVLVEEALLHDELAEFLRALVRQPPWSDLPLVLVASGGTTLGALVESVFPASGNVAVLERPLNPVSLVSAVRVGLRARHRQLQVRDLLAERDDALRKREEFLAMLAHELRNPLAPLRNAVYIMQQIPLHDEILVRTRDLIDRQTAHLKRLVDDLLEVSRLELGKVNLQLSPLDLNTAIAAVTEACLPVTAARRHTMEVRLAPQPLTVMADAVRIEQIIGNLITNAAKFTSDGGRIAVEARRDGDTAEIAVRDNGIGLKPEMLASVFDLFTQDARTLERAGGGLGIGLTIVKRLVELHGGSVSVSSEGPETGCVFTVRLPCSRDVVTTPGANKAAAAARASKRVLVVDDNADIRESLALVLRMWGHDVELAGTGPEGLKRAQDLKPDVAFIDIGLPELNGYDVASGIRHGPTDWAKRVTLVALTGYGNDSDRQRALREGFDLHLVKPVDPQALAEALELR